MNQLHDPYAERQIREREESEALNRKIDANKMVQRAIMMGIVAAMLFAVVLVIWAAIQ